MSTFTEFLRFALGFGVCGEGSAERRKAAVGGSGLKSRGLFVLVVTVTALKTHLGRTKSEDTVTNHGQL